MQEQLLIDVDDPERIEKLKQVAVDVSAFILNRTQNPSDLMGILALLAGCTIKASAKPEYKRLALLGFFKHVELVAFEPDHASKH